MLTINFLCCRILLNYEVSENCFTTYDEITSHAHLHEGKLTTSRDDILTSHIILRAVRDVFGDAISGSRGRIEKTTKGSFSISRKKADFMHYARNLKMNGRPYDLTFHVLLMKLGTDSGK